MGFINPVQPPIGPVVWQGAGTSAFVEKQDLEQGTLFIAESHVAWINAEGKGFNVPYPAITVHAVSKDLSAFPHECLYLMIDSDIMSELRDVAAQSAGGDAPVQNSEGSDDDTGFEEEEGTEVREIRFVPQDKSSLREMFDALSQCQALHPDPDDGSDGSDPYDQGDEGGDDGYAHDGDGGEDDAMDTGQFDDA
ncbi:methylosome subunit pICln-like [Diadema antillarum]|uniref:methylosome subunit pICln-like n=1 Tax=Diadema antillarum TaxID=105358 RepID=UPI003A8828FB